MTTSVRHIIQRPKLEALLAQNKINILQAPIGYGKSTLIQSWLNKPYYQHVWFKLNPTDNTKKNFLNNLLTTIHSKAILSNISAPLELSDLILQIKEFSQTSLNTSRGFFLVFDACHHILGTESEPYLIRLINLLPSYITPIILTRTRCNFSLNKTSNHLTENIITKDQLKFNKEEVLSLFDSKTILMHYSDGHIFSLENFYYYTAGWPVAISLLRNLILSTTENSTHTFNFSIFITLFESYFDSKLSNYLSADEISFLHLVSTLPTTSRELIQAKLPEKIATFTALQNKFLLDTSSQSICHEINFINRLMQQYFLNLSGLGQNQKNQLYNIADWYYDNGQIIYAIELLMLLKDWQKALQLIKYVHSKAVPEAIPKQKLNSWLLQIPRNLIELKLGLSKDSAWYQLNISPKDDLQKTILHQNEQLQHIKSTTNTLNPKQQLNDYNEITLNQSEPKQLSSINRLQSFNPLAEAKKISNLSEAISWVYGHRPLINLLPKNWFNSDNNKLVMLQVLALHKQSQVDLAAEKAQRGIENAMLDSDSNTILNCLILLLLLNYKRGQLNKLSPLLEQLESWFTKQTQLILPNHVNWLAGCRCLIALSSGNLPHAKRYMKSFKTLLLTVVDPIEKTVIYLIQALIHRSEFNTQNTWEVLEQAEYSINGPSELFLDQIFSIPALKADALLIQSKEALSFILTLPSQLVSQADVAHIQLKALYCYLCNLQPNAANATTPIPLSFHEIKQLAYQENHIPGLLYASILQALWLNHKGFLKQALTNLNQALHIAEKHHLTRLILNFGQPMGYLLIQAKSKSLNSLYIELLLDKTKGEPYASQLSYEFALLSKREREILTLMDQGLANKEIARRICRSLGTVKLHIHNIYRKLKVTNRYNAIQKFQKFNTHHQPQGITTQDAQ